MSSLTGRIFGNYQIRESVGRGGMATVYRALDRRDNSEVAIKFISPALAETEHFIQRFRREVKVVARLSHPNILPVLDYGEQDGYAYQVMPFVKVGSLSDRLDKGPISLEAGGRLLDQVALALAYAHQHGIVHRDVKPSNILLDSEGNALLADFGMARLVETQESLTGSAVIGTPAYMAPEQIQGGPVDARADQYALGVILFQLATGSLPYHANTPMGYLLKHVNGPFPAARQRNPQVPKSIEHVILKATAKKPNDRFESISEMNRKLQASLAFIRDPESNEAPTIILPGASRETAVAGIPPRTRRTLRIAGAVAAVLFFVLAVPVFASGLMDLLQQASSPAEGSAGGSMVELTEQVATIEALSTELAGVMSASDEEIELAVVQTLAAENSADGGITGAHLATPSKTATPTSELASASQLLNDTPSGTEVTPSPSAVSTDAPGASATATPPGSPSSTPAPGAPSSTPAPTTPVLTQTPLPSSTGVPTQTPSSIPPSLTPTNTPVPPTATQDACSMISLGGFSVSGDTASWNVTNSGPAPVEVERIVLNWRSENGALERIRFKNALLWQGSEDAPHTDLSSELKGAVELEGGGASKDLKFTFELPAQSSGYSLQVTLSGSCVRSSGG
jgi:serine/threonine-protein kinase